MERVGEPRESLDSCRSLTGSALSVSGRRERRLFDWKSGGGAFCGLDAEFGFGAYVLTPLRVPPRYQNLRSLDLNEPRQSITTYSPNSAVAVTGSLGEGRLMAQTGDRRPCRFSPSNVVKIGGHVLSTGRVASPLIEE